MTKFHLEFAFIPLTQYNVLHIREKDCLLLLGLGTESVI